MSVQLVDSWVI